MSIDYNYLMDELKKTVVELWENNHYSKLGMQKGERDIVTETDLNFEKQLIDVLNNICPEIPILSEETLSDTKEEGTFFTIDPVDGTWNYAKDTGIYGTQVALVENGEPTLGLIYLPVFKKLFTAIKGQGTYLNDERVYVKNETLDNSMIGIADLRRGDIDLLAELAKQIVKVFGKTRITGASCFGYSMVSCGSYQGRISVLPHLWDIAPGIILVNEAGGVSTFNKEYAIVASSKNTLDLLEQCYHNAKNQNLSQLF